MNYVWTPRCCDMLPLACFVWVMCKVTSLCGYRLQVCVDREYLEVDTLLSQYSLIYCVKYI